MLVKEEYITCGELIRLLDEKVEIINAATSEESNLDFVSEIQRLSLFETELIRKTGQFFKALPDYQNLYTSLVFLDRKLAYCRHSCLRGSTQYDMTPAALNPEKQSKLVFLLRFMRLLEDYKEHLQIIMQGAHPFQVPLELFRIPPGIDPEDIGAQTIPISMLSADGTKDLEQQYLEDLAGDSPKKRKAKKIKKTETAVFRITVAKRAFKRGRAFLESLKITGIYRLIAMVADSDEDYVAGQFTQHDSGRHTTHLHEPRADAFLDSLPKD